MDHLAANTQFTLTGVLSLSGVWLGSLVVRWSRPSWKRLFGASLGLAALAPLLYFLWVHPPIHGPLHLLIVAVAAIVNAAGWRCFFEWARVLPRPWGGGKTHRF